MRKTPILHIASAVLSGLMTVGCMALSADPPISSATTPSVLTVPTTVGTTSKAVDLPQITTAQIPTTADVPITSNVPTTTKAPTSTENPPVTTTPTPTKPPVTPEKPSVTETPSVHTHSYGGWQITKAAACTAAGIQQRSCSCGDTQTLTIPATGHSWSGWMTVKAATEQTEGEESRSCSVCKQTETRSIAKLSHTHSYGAWTTVKAATCTAAGTQQRACSCGATENKTIAATGHSFGGKTVAATCTEQGYTVYTCKNCKETYNDDFTAATGHSWSGWMVTKAPTEQTEGEESRSCSSCKQTETRAIAKLSHTHSYGAWTTVKAATCTATGTQQRSCSCGDKQTQTIPVTGHNWSSWTVTKAATCTAAGIQKRTCSRCNDAQTQSIPATGHGWSKTQTVPATCTEQGYTVYTCKTCKEAYTDDFTAATGHSWGDWIVTQAATTEAEGVEMRTCSGCQKKETRSINKLPVQGATLEDCEWMAEYFLQLLNEERAKAGVQQLVTDSKMKEMAKVRADELTVRFEHYRPNNKSYFNVFDDFKYGIYHDMTIHGLPESYNYYCPTKCDEDIVGGAYGHGHTMQECVERQLEAFKNSPGHWNSLMNGDFGAVGVAVSVVEKDGWYNTYLEVLLVDRLYE